MRILGVDTSLRSTGYGVIEVINGKARALDCGIIKNKPSLSHTECLHRLAGGIAQLIEIYQPQQASIEGVFFYKNAKTAMILGMARGAVLAELGKKEVPTYEYAPTKAKLAVTGMGKATKEQVAKMIAQRLNADISKINDDATDALALALCHWQTMQIANGSMLGKPL